MSGDAALSESLAAVTVVEPQWRRVLWLQRRRRDTCCVSGAAECFWHWTAQRRLTKRTTSVSRAVPLRGSLAVHAGVPSRLERSAATPESRVSRVADVAFDAPPSLLSRRRGSHYSVWWVHEGALCHCTSLLTFSASL